MKIKMKNYNLEGSLRLMLVGEAAPHIINIRQNGIYRYPDLNKVSNLSKETCGYRIPMEKR